MSMIDDVRRFHEAADIPILEAPKRPAFTRVKLRKHLLKEEHVELQVAMDGKNLADIAGEIVDVIYVAIGAALEYGIPLQAVWDEVHAANMRKVGPDGKVVKRADGKILKPAGWYPADVSNALRMDRAHVDTSPET
jgi:predicted HAD superfamily Cof-like phosphohydrolase